MHIEPGVVHGAKMILSYATAAAAAGYSLKLVADDLRSHSVASFAIRSLLATALIFCCFEVLPHVAVGVSEVHLILGTTVLLIFGAGPAAVGLAGGLAIQGLFFAPGDLPMYTVNVTTLLFPLFAIHALAARIIPADRPYVDLGYGDVLKLSVAYQGGIVLWVAFWAFYGQGFGVMPEVLSFGAAYIVVILIEPLADLAILAGAKGLHGLTNRGVFVRRLHHAA
jgi:ABC-type Co2+ transport system permease subunit